MMKSLKLSVAALLVLFSSTALAVPAVSLEHASKTATAVEHNVKTAKDNVSSLEKKVTKGSKNQKASQKNNSNKSKAGSTKQGANSALCKDGTYSKSKTHKGACSRHGGVAKWL
ncbi:conserved hypothetical protein; putative exported protein [Xenorhabdus bovienii str. Jollieti]|nr:DUF3761 domain-containing protein [Xenorhabdus bovienii]CDH28584.1 conserved hypothetical protein; putative exported protein [Xenorhabdus bovienii str. Jollieti]